MSYKVFGYHADVKETTNQVDELRLTVLWRERWERAGFEPVILGEHDAEEHTLYDQAKEVIASMPSVNPASYEEACWLRWFALAVHGGGLMADFDVIPRASGRALSDALFPGEFFDPEALGKLVVYQVPCCPSLTYANQRQAHTFCHHILERKYGQRDQAGRAHWSDQYALDDLMANGFVEARDVVKLWTDKDWEKAPVVHFANAVTAGKLEPRWKRIPDVLPL